MATLVLTAVGTVLGGPIGGSIGALVGSQIDAAIFGPKAREGARLKELAITTSSYGTPLARHFGSMRVGGSIIWATDLLESSEKTGGGKNQPSTKTYSYSSSFAVALGSRPIASVGRIWADGNLLRGAAGDLKVGGQFRFYSGHGDQLSDPLLASAEGLDCPAFRGISYCVFETLQLGEFGNRIPSLTFEVIADDGEVEINNILEVLDQPVAAVRPLDGLRGFSDEGGSLLGSMDTLDRVYPFSCDAGGDNLTITAEYPTDLPVATLPEAVVDTSSESFGASAGQAVQRRPDARDIAAGLRYYDVERDYQAGLQRAGGRALPGRNEIIEFPGALTAAVARRLADETAQRGAWAGEVLQWRIAELDPGIAPGSLVRVPGRPGRWRIQSWEWRETGIELELARQPNGAMPAAITDSGRSLAANDQVATPTILYAFELPWDGAGSADERQVYAAVSSETSGWTGAMLFADVAGSLNPVKGSGRTRSTVGVTVQPLPPAQPHIVDRASSVEVQLASDDFSLSSRQMEDLASGQNRAIIGDEIVQFETAESLGGGLWRLSQLLRGRGGTEHFAAQGQLDGAEFVLLDASPVQFSASEIGSAQAVAAIGVADTEPALSSIANSGRTRRPLAPVHPRIVPNPDSSLTVCWTRRARGAWTWAGTVEPPLAEQRELYEVGVGDPDQPVISWEVGEPQLTISAGQLASLQSAHSGKSLWVRQIGSHARSEALFILSVS